MDNHPKLKDVDAPPGQYSSSSTAPTSESPPDLFTFLCRHFRVGGVRMGSLFRQEPETHSGFHVCGWDGMGLGRLLVLQGIVLFLSVALLSVALRISCRWHECTEQKSLRLLSFSTAISLSGLLLQIAFLCMSSGKCHETSRREAFLVLSLLHLLFVAAVMFLFCGVIHIFLSRP